MPHCRPTLMRSAGTIGGLFTLPAIACVAMSALSATQEVDVGRTERATVVADASSHARFPDVPSLGEPRRVLGDAQRSVASGAGSTHQPIVRMAVRRHSRRPCP